MPYRKGGILVYSIEGAADRLSDPRFVLYFGYLRLMRMVTVITMAIVIVTVSASNIRCLLSVQTQIGRPGAYRAGRHLGRQKRPSPHIQRKF
jgi:hypothetical protein